MEEGCRIVDDHCCGDTEKHRAVKRNSLILLLVQSCKSNVHMLEYYCILIHFDSFPILLT